LLIIRTLKNIQTFIICSRLQIGYYYDEQMKKDDVHGTCSTHGGR
jgi:hypothetical protein